MAFQLGDIAERKESGKLRGVQREIACDCWFTSNGKSIPRVIKIMDELGVIQTINEIQLLFSEEKTYSGIKTVEHICNVCILGKKETVKLIFTKESCKWSIAII